MKLPYLAVLIPYSKGLMLFEGTHADNLKLVADSACPQMILHTIRQLPAPRLAIHVGAAYEDFLGGLVFYETDLCVIPHPWMRHIPRFRVPDRAKFAVQLLEAFLAEPIRLFGAKSEVFP